MKKRFLCLLMALCLIAVLLPVTALADEKPDAKWDFALKGNEKAPEDDQAELVMKAGDEAKYYATKQSDPSFPSNWYLTPGSESEWNVKFEYPADGIPTITMKDAKIVNGCGLWFGGYNIPMTSDVKLVLEGSNYISSAKYAGPLVFRTTGTATVTGSGKLEVAGDTHSMDSGFIASYGNLILDHANIVLNFPESWGKTNGLATRGGDIIMKGGSLTLVAYDDPNTTHEPGKDSGYTHNQESFYSAVYAKKREDGTGGNFTVQDGATFIAMGSPVASVSKSVELNKGQMIYVDGKFTIKDSTVELALIGKVASSSSLFGAKPTMEYANDTYYVVATKTKQPAVVLDTATLTPVMDKVVDYFSHTSLGQLTYFKVTPGGTGGPTSAQPPVVEEEEWVPPTEATTATTKPTTTTPTTAPTTATTPTTSSTKATEATKAPTKATEANTATTDKQDVTTGDDSTESGNGLMVVVIVICAVVIVGSGFALYWFVFRKKK